MIWHPSPNFAARTRPISMIVIHYTQMELKAALERLCDPAAQVSCHYLITREGEIFHLVSEEHCAWHAGKSYWLGETELNQVSIGIELDNLGQEPFPEPQLQALEGLIETLIHRHRIPGDRILGHSDIAPGRKVDPGPFFPWGRLGKRGWGLPGVRGQGSEARSSDP